MPKANNTDIFKYNEYPSLLDYLFGSDFEDYKKNKSFRLNSIIQLINNVNGINNTQYIFSDGSDPEIDYFDKGYFFTDNNETDPNGFTKIILNKESLQPIDLTLLFERLATISSLVLRLDNPSNPNNFFNFNITSIADEGNFFVFDVEPFENFFFGELINSTVYSVYFDVKANISDKLSRGGYPGTAQNLDDRINSVEFPNEILTRGPVLLENDSVSISANDFRVRINQNVVSNPNNYNVTINPATLGFNRTDIIIIDQYGVFTKIQGQESIDIAVKPVPSANTLEITSINITGNSISSPTPSDNAKLDRAGYNGNAYTLDQKIDSTRKDVMTRIDDFEYEMEEIKLPLKVDKVTGKSLLLDTEIIRLQTLQNFDNSGNISALNLKADKLTTYTKIEVNNLDAALVAALKDGVDPSGDTLQKLYNLIQGVAAEVTVANIAARNSLNVKQGDNVFVTDDGDGKWALYKATSAGVNATYVKLSDPDLLNALMTATQIKTAYESNSDTNAFTNALLSKLNAINANAQKNSDITKAEIEAKLTGEITSHTHDTDLKSITIEQLDVSVTWDFNHNLNNPYPVISVWEKSGKIIFPEKIESLNSNNLRIIFPVPVAGYASAIAGMFVPSISSGYDVNAQLFIDVVGNLSLQNKEAINQLVLDLKSSNIWNKLLMVNPKVGITASDHKWNLKDPRDLNEAYRQVYSGGWVRNSKGALGNLTNTFANTFVNPSALGLTNNISFGFYITQAPTVFGDRHFFGAHTGSNNYLSIQNSFSNSIVLNGYTSSYIQLQAAPSNNGFMAMSILGTSKTLYNKSLKSTTALSGNGSPNSNIYEGALNLNNAWYNSVDAQIGCSCIGQGLTDLEIYNLRLAIEKFETALGRNV